MADIVPLAEQLLAQTDGTFIVAWEHHYGEKLAKHLLVALEGNTTEVPDWDNADFDSIFVIRTNSDAQGKRHATFAHEQEGLNDLPEMCVK